MFAFFGRWLKGLIIGWILSFIAYLIKRAMTKAFQNVKDFENAQNAGMKRPANSADIVDTIWAGMTEDQLLATFGHPDTRFRNSAETEIWHYTKWNGQNTSTEVILSNRQVTSWGPAQPLSIESQAHP